MSLNILNKNNKPPPHTREGVCYLDTVLQSSVPILSKQKSRLLDLCSPAIPANLHLIIVSNSQ